MFSKPLSVFLVTVTLAAMVPSDAFAQRPGRIELGAYGRRSSLNESLGARHEFPLGIGGRLGFFVAPQLLLEGTASFEDFDFPLGAVASHVPINARLVFGPYLTDRVQLLLGAGYVHNEYTGSFAGSDDGVGGLGGFRLIWTDSWAARIDVVGDYIPSPAEGGLVSDNTNWGLQFGVSYLLGGGFGRDADHDGVNDSNDACARTAAGIPVDDTGCPLDSDSDGVIDPQDNCSNTPSAANVDRNGCPIDSDNDGVADYQDRCANTPAGTHVNDNGCPVDSDGDGVADAIDRCMNTPSGARVDANGCPLDSDSDGVADHADNCPNTPASATVNASGCPTDRDNDGVYDGLDRCSNTAVGTEVDASGCPVLFETEETTEIVLEGVNFETGSAELTPNARTILDRVAQSLIGNPDIRVEVGGHTDNTGGHAFNVGLSQRRAMSVREFLMYRGVTASQMTAQGYGPDEPIADNGTRGGRTQNRRVALKRLN